MQAQLHFDNIQDFKICFEEIENFTLVYAFEKLKQAVPRIMVKPWRSLYAQIIKAKTQNKKLLAILLDPDKIDWNTVAF
jgi:hypothetical protein